MVLQHELLLGFRSDLHLIKLNQDILIFQFYHDRRENTRFLIYGIFIYLIKFNC